MAETTPLWHARHEHGWPGEDWLSWPPSGPTEGVGPGEYEFVASPHSGVSAVEGSNMYWGHMETSHTVSHRYYPIVHGDEYWLLPPTSWTDKPVCNRYYVWLTIDSPFTTGQWISFATWGSSGNDADWGAWTLSVVDSDQIDQGAVAFTNLSGTPFPYGQWVRFTTYIDLVGGYTRTWMDGVPVIEADGGAIGGATNQLTHGHWGLYSEASVGGADMYNDSIQIWGLDEVLTDLDTEPGSPYEDPRWAQRYVDQSNELWKRF